MYKHHNRCSAHQKCLAALFQRGGACAGSTPSLEIWTARNPPRKKQLIIISAQPIRNVEQHFSREGVPMPAAPPPWKTGPPLKKTALSGGKTKKKLPNFFLRLCDTHKKYILQKNWVKTAIPALSSGQSNLHTPIWGCHRQLDDQHRNPNMNNKDHIVGQLTRASQRGNLQFLAKRARRKWGVD